jgi:CubicO group peptidase (beta-lactamase class C family)
MGRTKNYLFSLLVLLGLRVVAQQSTDIARFMRFCQSNFRFNGVVLVADSNKIIYEHAYGKANVQTNADNEPATRFRIGSMSKQFTSYAVLELVEEGKLSLNDRLAMFIDKFNQPGKESITVHHLLTHTSGLADYTNLKNFDEQNVYSEDSIVSMIAGSGLAFQPSTSYGYSNSNFFLLALVVEKTTGRDFGGVLHEKVLAKAGMLNSGEEQGLAIENEAKGYLFRSGSMVGAPFIEMKNTKGGGGMYSTAEDLLKWSLFFQHRLAVDTLFKNAIQPVSFPDGTKTIYACGWCLMRDLIFHEGHINGFASLIAIDTARHHTIILLTNDSYRQLYITMHALGNILCNRIGSNGWMANKPLHNLGDYAGVYSSGKFKVTIKDSLNDLVGEAFGQKRLLRRFDKDEFFLLNSEGMVKFERDKTGKVIALKNFDDYSWVTLKREPVRGPYSALKYDSVVMYDFEGGKGLPDLYIINDKGQLAKSVVKRVILDKETAAALSRRLGQKASFGGGQAACFDPHLGFVYYEHGKVVAYLTICLDCNRLYSSIEIPAQMQGVATRVGSRVDYSSAGPSKAFRTFLNELLVANHFSHQLNQ